MTFKNLLIIVVNLIPDTL